MAPLEGRGGGGKEEDQIPSKGNRNEEILT